jgi:hypothetical protein
VASIHLFQAADERWLPLGHKAPAALDTKLQGFFVGQLMKRTGGRADPKLANRILSEQLKG